MVDEGFDMRRNPTFSFRCRLCWVVPFSFAAAQAHLRCSRSRSMPEGLSVSEALRSSTQPTS